MVSKNISYDDLKTILFHEQLMSFIIIAGLEQFNAWLLCAL